MSRADRFDRADYQQRRPSSETQEGDSSLRAGTQEVRPEGHRGLLWPVEKPRVGDNLLSDRDGKGNPHFGVDLFVPAGSVVRAAIAGRVIRVKDGRTSKDTGRKRAGLWIDVLGVDGRVYRYLHLGTATTTPNAVLIAGDPIATVAEAYTSGSGKGPHLHFEVRSSDWSNGDYGVPIDPLQLLRKA